MNYPVWDLSFGLGLLMAIVSITHVFVSHFAVGGGLFLVLTEKKAYRENDSELLEWLKRHTKFFVLVTVVFGAISGVGIWFTIGLINPSGTSSLIHGYVWGWAIEWIFFFLEITSSLLYLYGWNKLKPKVHVWLGWIYFIAAFVSMVVINGIVTFMLTPGKWIQTHGFWDGFFNPTYFPSLFSRFAFALALAGIYALITAAFQKSDVLKAKLVKWSALWIVPAFILLVAFIYWYISNIPEDVWADALGKMPTATRYANIAVIFAVVTFILSLLTLVKPRKLSPVLSFLILFSAFTTMWGFEFVREAVRKPYVIYDYLYSNGIYASAMPGDAGMTIDNIDENGFLKIAKWPRVREVTEANKIEAGRDIFLLQCQSCHTVDGYRGLKKYIESRNWGINSLDVRLKNLDNMYNGVMAPFAGTEDEREALLAYLATLLPAKRAVPAGTANGATLFHDYCRGCHELDLENDPLFLGLEDMSVPEISTQISQLDSLTESMQPNPFEGNDAQREVLAKWINDQYQAKSE